MIKWGSPGMQRWFNIRQINEHDPSIALEWKTKGYDLLPECRKSVWKFSLLIYDKNFNQFIMLRYKDFTSYSVVKNRAFPLRSGLRQGRPLSPSYSTQCASSPHWSNQARKRKKKHNWKSNCLYLQMTFYI